MSLRSCAAFLMLLGTITGCRSKPLEVVREIESWESPDSIVEWKAWDASATILRDSTAVHGQASLRLFYDFAKYQWPLAFREYFTAVRLDDADALAVEVHVPASAAGSVDLMIGLVAGAKHASGRIPLKAGWNSIRVPLSESWLPGTARASASRIELILVSDSRTAAGSVHFDRLRLERQPK